MRYLRPASAGVVILETGIGGDAMSVRLTCAVLPDVCETVRVTAQLPPAPPTCNGQIRWWLPEGTDLTVHSQADLDGICHVLNTQPRRSLGWRSPNDLYAAHAAH
ncbi:hypothetical protein BH23ACT9_BH23ACT9_28720 [soil metagenome]